MDIKATKINENGQKLDIKRNKKMLKSGQNNISGTKSGKS